MFRLFKICGGRRDVLSSLCVYGIDHPEFAAGIIVFCSLLRRGPPEIQQDHAGACFVSGCGPVVFGPFVDALRFYVFARSGFAESFGVP